MQRGVGESVHEDGRRVGETGVVSTERQVLEEGCGDALFEGTRSRASGGTKIDLNVLSVGFGDAVC